MEQFHWTEAQLNEENSLLRILQISEYNKIKNQVAKEEENRSKSGSRSPNVIINR
jgi:hypothetical protein